MRVIVCGGRDFEDRDFVYGWLDRLFAPDYGPSEDAQPWWLPRPDLFLVLGGARGVDRLAEDWATVNWVRHIVYPAMWDLHGRAAGAIRNKEMLEEQRPEMVVAFPGGRGTEHMCRIAEEAGVAVLRIALRPAPVADTVVGEEDGEN
jgi:hypothetical protein